MEERLLEHFFFHFPARNLHPTSLRFPHLQKCRRTTICVKDMKRTLKLKGPTKFHCIFCSVHNFIFALRVLYIMLIVIADLSGITKYPVTNFCDPHALLKLVQSTTGYYFTDELELRSNIPLFLHSTTSNILIYYFLRFGRSFYLLQTNIEQRNNIASTSMKHLDDISSTLISRRCFMITVHRRSSYVVSSTLIPVTKH